MSFLLIECFSYEITARESILANITCYASRINFFHNSMLGEQLKVSPLYSWLSILVSGGHINQLTIRAISIISLFGMGTISFFAARRFGGIKSAWPAFLLTVSSLGAIKMAIRAEETMLSSLFISLAWMTWYSLSRNSKSWKKAWFWGIFFTSLSASINGPQMYIFFYLPTLFMTTPTDVRRRLVMLPHAIALAANILIIIIVQYFLNFLARDHDAAFYFFNSEVYKDLNVPLNFDQGHLKAMAKFAGDAFLYYLPGSFIAWTGFCEAYRLIEKKSSCGPNVFRYLRRIVTSLFFACMIYPDSNPYALTPLAVPLSIIASLHYPIFIKRYHKYAYSLIRILKAGSLVCALIVSAIAYYRLSNRSINSYQQLHLISGMALAIISMLVCLLCYTRWIKQAQSFCLYATLVTVCLMSSIFAARHIQYKEFKYSNRQLAMSIQSKVTPQTLLYNFTGENLGQMFFYLENPSQNVTEAIPPDQLADVIYVIADEHKPVRISTDSLLYKWENLTEELPRDKNSLILYKGSKALIEKK